MAAPAKCSCFSFGLGLYIWSFCAEGEDGESLWQGRAGYHESQLCLCLAFKTLTDEITPQYGPVELALRISSVTRDKRIMNSCSQSSGETSASSREARVHATPGVHRITHQGAGGKYIWCKYTLVLYIWCKYIQINKQNEIIFLNGCLLNLYLVI